MGGAQFNVNIYALATSTGLSGALIIIVQFSNFSEIFRAYYKAEIGNHTQYRPLVHFYRVL